MRYLAEADGSARHGRAQGLRHGAVIGMLVALTSAGVASAQVVTLPTVRLGGPPAEERQIFALYDSVTRFVRGRIDTLEVATETSRDTAQLHVLQRAIPKLDSLMLSVVDDDATDWLEEHCASDQLTRDDRIAVRDALDATVGAGIRTRDEQVLLRAGVAPKRAEKRAKQAAKARRARAHIVRLCSDADTLQALARSYYDTDSKEIRRLARILAWYDSGQRVRRALSVDTSDSARERLKGGDVPEIRERDVRRLLPSFIYDERLPKELRAQMLRLTQLATMLVIFRKFDERDGRRPVRDRAQAEVFWGQQGLAPLNVGAFAGSSKSALAYTEIASGILNVFRASVSAVVSQNTAKSSNDVAETSAQQDAAAQRLLSSGGLLNLALAYPLIHWANGVGSNSVTLLAVPRAGLTAPTFGGVVNSDTAAVMVDAGLELHAKYLDLIGGLGLVGQVRGAFAAGSAPFGDQLGIRRNRLGYASLALGFVFGKQYLLTASRPIAAPPPIRRKVWTVGLTISRLRDLSLDPFAAAAPTATTPTSAR